MLMLTLSEINQFRMLVVENLPFDKHKWNKYSANGEDGILDEILRQLNLENLDKWCVEFGAWDGKFLSNTFNLVEQGWNAVYIESDELKFKDLLRTVDQYPSIIPILALVSRYKEEDTSLDNLLSNTKIPLDFDILSIDIDSYDLDIWESVEKYLPKIVVIEINSSVIPGILQRHSQKLEGNSFSSTLSVGINKGYTLVAHTGNLIFVQNDLINRLNLENRYLKYPELLFDPSWIKSRKSLLSFFRHKFQRI